MSNTNSDHCACCGSPLDFSKSAYVKCTYCQNTNTLVRDARNERVMVTYFPVPSKAGKMVTELKLALVKMMAEHAPQYLLHTHGSSICSWLYIADDAVACQPITFSKDPEQKLDVGTTYVKEEPISRILFIRPAGTKKLACCENKFEMKTIPVVVDGRLLGHRLLIDVLAPQYEDEANKLGELISEQLDVTPEISLSQIGGSTRCEPEENHYYGD